ncbi:HdeD family acid-resistance protein [Rubrobacter aplysinae]|uniref:HdeD family acid-resistance protein n=1 Tax=Rubrobacter aplysinae TaxID=909625 RepID=UPI00064BD0C2|nr:HdeD family acid-resistance protein [Rubrobacter aplysinae]
MERESSAQPFSRIAGPWWALALRGAIALLFGLAALLRPDITLFALVVLFGAYMLVDGVFAIGGVFGGASRGRPRWLLLIEGVFGVLAGLVAFVLPGLAAVALLYLIAAWAIITGVIEIVLAIELRREIEGEWAMIAGGVVSVLFGIILAVLPGVGIVSLVWLVGIYAIIFGVLLLILGFRVRSRRSSDDAGPGRVA